MKPCIRLATILYCGAAWASEPPPKTSPSAEMVLDWVRYGNERHVQGKYVYWHQSLDRRREVARQERPHAVVLTCSDSRVPPELLFDQGIGDLYVVRVAGNVAGEKELGSIEYAVEQLGAPLVVVLGHQRCHAVETAVRGGELSGHIGSIVASLSPAVAQARRMGGGDVADQAIRINVQTVAEQLRSSEPVLSRLVRAGMLKIAGGYYSLDSGEVSWLPNEGGAVGAHSAPSH